MRAANVLHDVATSVAWAVPVGAGLGLINANLAEGARAQRRAECLAELDASITAVPAAAASFILLSDEQHADWAALRGVAAAVAGALAAPGPGSGVADALAEFYKASRVEVWRGVPADPTLAAAHGTLLRLAAGGGGEAVLPASASRLGRSTRTRNMVVDTLKVVGVVGAASALLATAVAWAAEARRASSTTAWTASLPPYVAHTPAVLAAFSALANARGASLPHLRKAAIRANTLLALQAACFSGAWVPLEAGQSAAQLRASVDRHLVAFYDASGVSVLPHDGAPVDADLAEAHSELARHAHNAVHNIRLKAQEALFSGGE